MNILVTGGTGFIGRHLVSALSDEGHAVWVVTRQPCELQPPASGVQWLHGDLVSDDLGRLIPETIELVYHVAGMGSPARCQADPAACMRTNVTATHRLLEAVCRRRLRRFVFVSSAYVYGDTAPVPTPEATLLAPTEALGASKAAAEFLVRGYGAGFRMPVTVFRCYTVYGPGSGRHQLIPSLIEQVRRDLPVVTIQDPRPTRDFLEIRDAVRELMTALSHAGPCEVLNLGTGVETSVGALCRLLLEVSGREKEIRIDGRSASDQRIARQCAEITNVMTTQGWQPRIPLREGLARMLAGMEEVKTDGRDAVHDPDNVPGLRA